MVRPPSTGESIFLPDDGPCAQQRPPSRVRRLIFLGLIAGLTLAALVEIAAWYVAPRLHEADGGWHLEVECRGGIRAAATFEHDIAQSDMPKIPGLIADDVLRHLGVELPEKEREWLLTPQIQNESHAVQLAHWIESLLGWKYLDDNHTLLQFGNDRDPRRLERSGSPHIAGVGKIILASRAKESAVTIYSRAEVLRMALAVYVIAGMSVAGKSARCFIFADQADRFWMGTSPAPR